MRNGARLDAVDINALSVSNGIDGSNISIVGDLHDLITILETDIMGPADSEDEGKKGKRPSSGGWFTSFDNQGTQLAFLRRLRVAADAMKGVIRSDVDHPAKYRFEFNQHRVRGRKARAAA